MRYLLVVRSENGRLASIRLMSGGEILDSFYYEDLREALPLTPPSPFANAV